MRLPSVVRLFLALALLRLMGACDIPLPTVWLIDAAPTREDGSLDPNGKLRVLAVRADPPEAGPGEVVKLSALVVTHPRSGERALIDGQLAGTPTVPGLTARFYGCRLPAESGTVETEGPCGVTEPRRAVGLGELPLLPGPATELRIPDEAVPGDTVLVTLLVADAAQPGGAEGCRVAARERRGAVPDPNHCVIATKRIAIASGGARNHNPELKALYLSTLAGGTVELPATTTATYPQLPAELGEDDRPSLVLAGERADDAVENEPDPADRERRRAELLTLSLFVTAGTLSNGRATFLDDDCAQEEPLLCAQRAHALVVWRPPSQRAFFEAPDSLIYFFAVLRDDRGGVSWRPARARAVPP